MFYLKLTFSALLWTPAESFNVHIEPAYLPYSLSYSIYMLWRDLSRHKIKPNKFNLKINMQYKTRLLPHYCITWDIKCI